MNDNSLNFYNMTLNQIMDTTEKFSCEKNGDIKKINMTKENGNNIISMEITEYPNGEIYCFNKFKKLKDKKCFKIEIQNMRKKGMKQTEIASILGISQSTVSKLLSEMEREDIEEIEKEDMIKFFEYRTANENDSELVKSILGFK